MSKTLRRKIWKNCKRNEDNSYYYNQGVHYNRKMVKMLKILLIIY
jgi:hypothetical protein